MARAFSLAEGVGFEPTVGDTHNRFQDGLLQPLGHPSGEQSAVSSQPSAIGSSSILAAKCRASFTRQHSGEM